MEQPNTHDILQHVLEGMALSHNIFEPGGALDKQGRVSLGRKRVSRTGSRCQLHAGPH